MRECPKCGICLEDAIGSCPTHGACTETTLSGTAVIDGKYRLECCLGRGGMGAVYRARHLGLNRLFALKLILPYRALDPKFLALFRAEAEALGRLRHRNIVEVTDFGVDGRGTGLPYLVMVHLEGESLGQVLQGRGPLALAEALPVLEAMAEAMDFAHRNGILHLDLKPANVFLARDHAGQTTVKILDFGLARMLDAQEPRPIIGLDPPLPGLPGSPLAGPEITLPLWAEFTTAILEQSTLAGDSSSRPMVMGTLGYMAPEVLRGEAASAASDVYAFGVILFGMLVGKPPFQGTVSQCLYRQSQERPPRPSALRPALPRELDGPIQEALDPEPLVRPPTLQAVLERVRAADGRHRVRRETPRRLGLAAALGLLVAGAVGSAQAAGWFQGLEHRQTDQAFRMLRATPPDPRIVLVTLGEATLDQGPEYFFKSADGLTERATAILDHGAAALVVDLLLPRRFSEAQGLSTLALAHSDRLVLGLFSQEDGSLRGWECLPDLTRMALGATSRWEGLFGLVNLHADGDGRVRGFRTRLPSAGGRGYPALCTQAYLRLGGAEPPSGQEDRLIDFSVDPRRFACLDWAAVPGLLRRDPAFFQGKCVILGVEASTKEDVHDIPAVGGRATETSGLRIHALMLQTLLERRRWRPLPSWVPGLLAGALGAASAWMLVGRRRVWPGVALAAAGAALCCGLAWGLWTASLWLPLPAALAGLALALGSSLLLRALLSETQTALSQTLVLRSQTPVQGDPPCPSPTPSQS